MPGGRWPLKPPTGLVWRPKSHKDAVVSLHLPVDVPAHSPTQRHHSRSSALPHLRRLLQPARVMPSPQQRRLSTPAPTVAVATHRPAPAPCIAITSSCGTRGGSAHSAAMPWGDPGVPSTASAPARLQPEILL